MALIPIPKMYKYMRADRLVQLIKERSIRFTQPQHLNDPYECHLTFDRDAMRDDYRQHRKLRNPELSEEELEERVDMAEDQLVIDTLLRYREMRNNFGVLSLTEDPLQLLMWAHYAEEHKGAVVELDIWHPCLRPGSSGGDKYSDIHRVDYTDEKVHGIPTPTTVIDVLCRKSEAWAYEKEWRLIRTINLLRKVSDEVFVVDIDIAAISAIYLGARFPGPLLDPIKQCISSAEGSHITLKKVVMAPHKFELRLVDPGDFAWTLLHREHHFGEAAEEALLCVPMVSDVDEYLREETIKSGRAVGPTKGKRTAQATP